MTSTEQAKQTLIFKSSTNEKADEFGVRQYRIPHVTKGPDGSLIVSVAGRTNKAGDNGRTTSAFAISKDEGKTWEHIRYESDYAKPTEKGAFPMSSRTNEVQVEWFPALKKYVALFSTKGKCYLIYSDDLRSWGEPQLIPNQENFSKSWPSPTSMHIEKDGTLFFNMIVALKDTNFSKRAVQMFWTKDGKTFETSGPPPFATGECNAYDVGDGHYVMVARTRDQKLGRMLFSYHRKTKQWGELQSLPVYTWYSCEQDLLLHQGKLYVSAPAGKGRDNGTIYVSGDKGESWKVHHKMKAEYSFGYSAMVGHDDSSIGLVFEKNSGPGTLLDIIYTKIPSERLP